MRSLVLDWAKNKNGSYMDYKTIDLKDKLFDGIGIYAIFCDKPPHRVFVKTGYGELRKGLVVDDIVREYIAKYAPYVTFARIKNEDDVRGALMYVNYKTMPRVKESFFPVEEMIEVNIPFLNHGDL